MPVEETRPELPPMLRWLADAPLLIDSDQVSRFYDAVARPQIKHGPTTHQITEETARTISGKLGFSASLSPGEVAGLLMPLFAFVKPKVESSVEGQDEMNSKAGNSISFQT